MESDWEYKDGRILPVKGGEILPFVPGKTWINIVPDLDAASISKGEGV
ncbi:Putative lipoprotein YerB precursor [Bacillus velezensis]